MLSADYFPDTGGIAAHVHYISRGLANAGADVTVVGGHILERSNHEADRDPLVREYLYRRTGPRGIRGILFAWHAYWQMHKLIRSESWDIIHFHNFLPDAAIVGLQSRRKKITTVLSNHSDALLMLLDEGRSLRWVKSCASIADGIIGPSQELVEKTSLIVPEKTEVRYIPNGVDIKRFAPTQTQTEDLQRLGIPLNKPILLAARRHDPKCGLDYLLRAMPAVIESHPQALLVLAGDGAQTNELLSIVQHLKIEESVKFLGRVNHESLPYLYSSAYVSILPSIYEAVSLSGLESLACGCPVVGTNVGGIPQFLTNGENGLIVPPRSPEALAGAIIRLLDSPDLREQLAKAAREKVSATYGWDAIARRTITFYQDLGRRKGLV